MGNNIGTSNPWLNQGSNYLVGLWTMTQNTAVTVVFTALALGTLILAYIVYKHLKAQSRMMHYKQQGVTLFPGYDRFYYGNTQELGDHAMERVKNMGKKITPHVFTWLLNNLESKKEEDTFDASKHPVAVINIQSEPLIFIQDPRMAQELFTTKSSIYDKTGTLEGVFSPLLGKAFLFAKSDADWKAKRKACAHAFYKERLEQLLGTIQDKVQVECTNWMKQIEQSDKQQTTIDLNSVFNVLYARNIIHICFGEDLSDMQVTLKLCKNPGDDESALTEEVMTFATAINVVVGQILTGLIYKLQNPFYTPIYNKTGISLSLTKFERLTDENCKRLRKFVSNYVAKRRSGQLKSNVSEGADLLSLFFSKSDIFTNEFIIDELFDFFMAATQTTQLLTQTVMGHFATDKDSLSKVREQFLKMIRTVDKEQGEADIKTLSKEQLLRKYLTTENSDHLYHLHHVIDECLRWQTPVAFASDCHLTEDATVGDIHIKAYDAMRINYHGLHMNPGEWQRPNEFLPQRFDPTDPLYLTPNGNKRHPMSFVPFNGGKRICFGKRFTEVIVVTVSTYMSQYFDMQYQETEKYPDKDHIHQLEVQQSEFPPVPFILTENQ